MRPREGFCARRLRYRPTPESSDGAGDGSFAIEAEAAAAVCDAAGVCTVEWFVAVRVIGVLP